MKKIEVWKKFQFLLKNRSFLNLNIQRLHSLRCTIEQEEQILKLDQFMHLLEFWGHFVFFFSLPWKVDWRPLVTQLAAARTTRPATLPRSQWVICQHTWARGSSKFFDYEVRSRNYPIHIIFSRYESPILVSNWFHTHYLK